MKLNFAQPFAYFAVSFFFFVSLVHFVVKKGRRGLTAHYGTAKSTPVTAPA